MQRKVDVASRIKGLGPKTKQRVTNKLKSKRQLERKQLSAEADSSVLSNESIDNEKLEVSSAKLKKKGVKNQIVPILKSNGKEAESEEDSEESGSDEGDRRDTGNEDTDNSDVENDDTDNSDGEYNASDNSDVENDDTDNSDGESDDADIGNDSSEETTIASKSKKQDNMNPSQMLHKVDVANLITSLRPKIKQGVTFLAHHNSKEIKKLETRKGKNADKCKRKAETLRLENLLLQKIELDEVGKYAMMLDFSQREKLLGDINLPLETKVMTKIATQKCVVSHLEVFRAKHPEWKAKLPGTLKALGIYTQFKKKVRKNVEKSKRKLERKQLSAEADSSVLPNESIDNEKVKVSSAKLKKKVVKNENAPILKSNGKEAESEEDSEEDGSDEGGRGDTDNDDTDNSDVENDDTDNSDGENDDSDNCNVENDDTDNSNVENDDTDNSDGESDDADIGKDSSEETTLAFKTKNQKAKNITPQEKKRETHISSGSVVAEVRRFADLQKEDNSQRKLNIISTRLPSPDPAKKAQVEEDRFFMTGANSFLKTVTVKGADREGVVVKKEWSDASKNLPGNRRQRRAQFTGNELKPKKKAFGNQFDRNDRRISNDFDVTRKNDTDFAGNNKKNMKDVSKFNRTNFGNKNTGNYVQSNSDETLHPSWAAKRNQKVSLDSFQGKKIKFDEDATGHHVPSHSGNFRNKNTGNVVQSASDETLHPSWAAKRNQKVSLDSFQGKKIKFDDN